MKALKNEVLWSLVFLMILEVFVSEKIFFVISLIFFLSIIYKQKFKLYIPKIPGLKAYCIMCVVAFVVGLTLYTPRNVARDTFYFLPTITWIFIGYNLKKFHNPKIDIFKIIFLYGSFISIYSIIMYLLNFSLDFQNLRTTFGIKIYEVGFILPIMVFLVFVYKNVYFGKKIDRFLIVIMFLQVALSFGRISILQPIIVFLALMLYEWLFGNKKKIAFKYTILSVVFILIFGIIVYNLLPSEILKMFSDKIVNSFTEVDSSISIVNTSEAMNNWRAYEIQAEKSQWLSSNILIKIFGDGFGFGTYCQFIPYSWDWLSGNRIALLHNGYYTCLEKLGVVGLIALISMFAGTIFNGIKNKRKITSNILVAICVGAIANTFVVRGPIQQGTFLVWALLLGWCTF